MNLNRFEISVGLFWLHTLRPTFLSYTEARAYILKDIKKYEKLSVVITEIVPRTGIVINSWKILNQNNELKHYYLLDHDDIFSEQDYDILCQEQPDKVYPILKTLTVITTEAPDITDQELENLIHQYFTEPNFIPFKWMLTHD